MDFETLRLLQIAAGVAFVAHLMIRRYDRAVLIVVLVAPLLYTAESMTRLSLPPSKVAWLPMILPFLMLYSLGPAALIGLPFLLRRRGLQRRAAQQAL